VWATDALACVPALRERFPEHDVLELSVAVEGALDPADARASARP
jgi:hypothetical protein